MDDRNAGRERLRRAREADGLPVEPDTAGIGRVNARENPAERALAGAVLAAERVAAARSDLDADIIERHHAGKALGDALEADGGNGCQAG